MLLIELRDRRTLAVEGLHALVEHLAPVDLALRDAVATVQHRGLEPVQVLDSAVGLRALADKIWTDGSQHVIHARASKRPHPARLVLVVLRATQVNLRGKYGREEVDHAAVGIAHAKVEGVRGGESLLAGFGLGEDDGAFTVDDPGDIAQDREGDIVIAHRTYLRCQAPGR